MGKIEGFAVLGDINTFRVHLFEIAHYPQANCPDRSGSWFCHKVVSLISLPANIVAVGVGALAMTVTACTLGTFKIVVYTLSFGKVSPDFSIGYKWLMARTIMSLTHVVKNIVEICYDVGCILSACKVDRLFTFVKYRFELGINKALQDEKALEVAKLPTCLTRLQEATSNRSYFTLDHSYSIFMQHKMLSLINIPTQVLTAIGSGVSCGVCLVLACAKVTLFATTNIHVSSPTGIFYTGRICLLSAINSIQNGSEIIADVAVGMYRIAKACRLAAPTKALLCYIPKAIYC